MNLISRISRIEKRNTSGNPLEALTDDELEAAIVAARARLEAETGMSATEYAEDLSRRIVDGTLSDDLDPETARQFVAAILSSVNGRTRTL